MRTKRCTETQRGCWEPSLRVVQSIHTKSSYIYDLELRFIPPSDSTHWIQLLATSELLLQISGSARLRKSFRNLRLNQGGKLMKIGELKDWFHTYKRKPFRRTPWRCDSPPPRPRAPGNKASRVPNHVRTFRRPSREPIRHLRIRTTQRTDR